MTVDFVPSPSTTTKPLSSSVPTSIKLLFLTWLAISFILKIGALITPASRVQIIAHLEHVDHETIPITNFFLKTFSFPTSIKDLYHAAAYWLLSVLIVGSAIVPMLRHVALVVCLYVPMSRARRMTILRAFNVVGRLEFTNIFISSFFQLTMFRAFNFTIIGNIHLKIEIFVVPARAAALGIVCTLIITALNSFLLYLDERNWEIENDESVVVPTVATFLLSATTTGNDVNMIDKRQRLLFSSSTTLTSQSGFVLFLVAGMCCYVHLTLSDSDIVSFSMNGGLIGAIIQDLQPGWTDINIMAIPAIMPRDSEQVLGSLAIAGMYVLVVFVCPITLALCSIIVAFGDLTDKMRRRWLRIHNLVIQPLSCLDVFALSCVSTAMEMHLVVGFTFDEQLPAICQGVKEVMGMKCAQMACVLHPIGLGALLGASIGFWRASYALTYAVRSDKELVDVGLTCMFNNKLDGLISGGRLLGGDV